VSIRIERIWIRVGHLLRGRATRVVGVAREVKTAGDFRGREKCIRNRAGVAHTVVGRIRSRAAEIGVDVIETGVDVADLDVFAMDADALAENFIPESAGAQKINIGKRRHVLRRHQMNGFHSGHRRQLGDSARINQNRDAVIDSLRPVEHLSTRVRD